MQRVLRRSERATRVATRQKAKKDARASAAEAWQRKQTQQRTRRIATGHIKQARQQRREDFEAGPLAPRRDVGEVARTYGATSVFDLPTREKGAAERARWVPFAEGDRVVVTRGRDKGRIDVVRSVDRKGDTVTLKRANAMDVFAPKWLQQQEGFNEVVAHGEPVGFEDVRLVYALPEEGTGRLRDVVVERLEALALPAETAEEHFGMPKRAEEQHRKSGERPARMRRQRVIAGTNTVIPWPEEAEEVFEDYADDTMRITVDEQTVRPLLLHPPMPTSVIDELRNKYSRFRTRHEWEYVRQKEEEDARDAKRKDLQKTMRTPLQELAELRAEQKKREEKQLTEEQLAKIGEVMSKEMTELKQPARLLER